jgi:hypothetical protein
MKYYGPGSESPYTDKSKEDKLEKLQAKELDSLNNTIGNLHTLPIKDISSESLSKIFSSGEDGEDKFEVVNNRINVIEDKIGNKDILKLTDAEGSELAKNNQEEIKLSPMIYLRGDNSWEYAKYKEYWFTRSKGSKDDWVLMKGDIDKSALEKEFGDEDNRWAQPSESELKALIDAW